MEVVLGGITSLLYGAADFLGGEGAKRVPAPSFVFWAGVMSFPLIVAAALLVGGSAGLADHLLGLLAGALGGVGLISLFTGLSRGNTAAVAPTAAATAAILPVIVALIDGERPSTMAWAGVVIAVPAIALCAWTGGRGGDRAGLVYGIVAGLGFGGFTAVIRFTSDGSELLPLIASRASTMLLVLVVAAFGVWRLVGFGSAPRAMVAANAVLDVSGNVTLLLAVRSGSLALAAVAASFYPAVTVMLARAVNSELLLPRQVAGLILALVAMLAIAAG